MSRGDETAQLDLPWEEDEPVRPRRERTAEQRSRRRDQRRRKGRSYTAVVIAAVLLLAVGAGVYWGIGLVQGNQRVKEWLASDYGPGEMGDPPFARVAFTEEDGIRVEYLSLYPGREWFDDPL